MNENDMFNEQLNLQKQSQDVSYLQGAQPKDYESTLSKHLESSEQLEYIQRLLMGYEYDSNSEEWKPIMKEVEDASGQLHAVEQGPLLDPNYIRMTIGYLKTFLNSNVYLGYLEKIDQLNEIMWDVKKKLVNLLHPLKKVYDARLLDVTSSMIEHSIYFALTRGYRKNTLDAMSKMQHSIEHLSSSNANPAMQQPPTKQFKLF